MKKKFLHAMSLALILSMLVGSRVAFADTAYNETEDPGTMETQVNLEIASTFSIKIPKTIATINNTANYTVGVKGDIRPDETLYITPTSTIDLRLNDKSVVANVTQPKTKWVKADVNTNSFTDTTATVTASQKLTAGDWTGIITFNIRLIRTLEPGLYDADNKLLCTWADSGIDASLTFADASAASASMASANYVLTNVYPETKKVVLPNGVTQIGNFNFAGCSDITSIQLPDGIGIIKESAFEGCTALTEVVFPSTLTVINERAFKDCICLSNLYLPEGVVTLGAGAFDGCFSLTEVIIPNGVTTLPDAVFSNCTLLDKVVFPRSLATLHANAFENNNITKVVFKGMEYTNKTTLEAALTGAGASYTSGSVFN